MLRPGERLDDLYQGGRRIIQNAAAPCFALDALLLAAFAPLQEGDTVVDFGTGTGILPLLLTARADCRVVALELMPQMAEMAARSMALNGLGERVRVIEGDLRQAAHLLGRGYADLLVCNPPYYPLGSGRVSADPLFAAARSERHCTLAEVVQSAAAVLKPLGRLALVNRCQRLPETMVLLAEHGLQAECLRLVQPFAERPANLFLLQARKGGRQEFRVLSPCIVYQAVGRYGAELAAVLHLPEGE